MKRRIGLILLLVFLLGLCSCGKAQPEPEQEAKKISLSAAVSQSEDGAVPDTVVIGEEAEAAANEAAGTETAPIGWNEELTSANGEVKVSIHDDAFDGIPETMPVITVRPRTITADEAEQMARVLYGDATLYEYGWMLSRAEIERRIAGMEKGMLRETIVEEYGDRATEELIEYVRSARQKVLDHWREAWAHSSDEIEDRECDWLFRPFEYWDEFGHDYNTEYPTYTDEIPFGVSAMIRLTGELDGRSTEFWVHNLERTGFWDHSITMYHSFPSGISQSEALESTGLVSGTAPTDEELRQAEQNAAALLESLGLGEWRCEAEPYELTGRMAQANGRYLIRVTGWKIREGLSRPVFDERYWDSPKDGGYMESAVILCSLDGKLLELGVQGLLDEGESETVSLISLDEAMAAAHEAMAAWTLEDRFRFLQYETDVPTGLTREITSVSVGQYRKQTGEFSYELVPVLSFYGAETLEGVPDYDEYFNDREAIFLLIDLRDGSVIEPERKR